MPNIPDPLTVTTWNLENADYLVGSDLTAEDRSRRTQIAQVIRAVDPDVLCVQEGPSGEAGIQSFANEVLDGDWVPVLLTGGDDEPGTYDDAYQIQEFGDFGQWIWFLVRPELTSRCTLQSPSKWQDLVDGDEADGNGRPDHCEKGKWPVHYWGETDTSCYEHFRHPQVLKIDTGAESPLELIGVHLKSKAINEDLEPERDEDGDLVEDYVRAALEARIKMASQARDVRRYVGERFDQASGPSGPGLLVLGDCNDGPGQDLFEEQYLFFNLVTNLQGKVLMAERYFNHALFDVPKRRRWTARFPDEVTGTPASENPLLLDHILMSQPLCNGSRPLEAQSGAGRVEHEIFERVNAEAPDDHPPVSDHRPVSLTLTATS